MKLLLIAAVTLTAIPLHGCSQDTIDCRSNTDCLQGEIPGICVRSPVAGSDRNWCAFPDDSCAGRYRWGVASGDGIAGHCVDEALSDGGGPDAGEGMDAALPDGGPSTRIFVDDGNSGIYVYDSQLAALGAITLPPLGGYNLGMSITSDSVYMVRGGDSYVVVGVDPTSNVVRPGFPKTISMCTPRFVGAEGLYCLSGSKLQLYGGPNYTSLLHEYTSPTLDMPLPEAFDSGLLLVLIGKSVYVLDALLGETGPSPIVSSTTPHTFALSKEVGRVAIADNNSVRIYDLTTRAQVGTTLTFTPTVQGLVFDSQKLNVTLSDGTITAYSIDGASTLLIAPVNRGGSFPHYDATRNRIVLLRSGNLVVLDASTLQHVSGSPVTLPTGGANVLTF